MPDLTPKQIEAMFAAVDQCNLADIKQVVRCKDCKYANTCKMHRFLGFNADDYCSYGKRNGR